MRLYLSSYKFGDHADELTKLAGESTKAVVIMNAVDFGDSGRATESLEKQITILTPLWRLSNRCQLFVPYLPDRLSHPLTAFI